MSSDRPMYQDDEWEEIPSDMFVKENGEIVVYIQQNPPGEPLKYNGYAEVWIDERPLRVRGVQFYADGDDVAELKAALLEWREKFKVMMEEA